MCRTLLPLATALMLSSAWSATAGAPGALAPDLRFGAVLRGEAAPDPESGPPPANDLQWFLFANHCHSEHSHDSATPVAVLLSQAALHGASAINVTDHRTLTQCSDDDFHPFLGVYPMCGEEWGSDGHAGLLNMPPDGDPMDGWTIPDMVLEATAQGATIVANHPFYEGDPWPEERVSEGIEGIEVWNGPWWWMLAATLPNQQATRWWQDHLEEGRRIFAIGGSDVHYVGLNPLRPCNYVLAEGPEPEAIQRAVEAGRLGISEDEKGPRAFLWADADGDGEYETPMGTDLEVASPTWIGIRIAVKKGKGDQLFLYTREGLVHSTKVDHKSWELRLAARVDATTRDFLRIELRGTLTNTMKSMTNPIYVNYGD